MRNLSLSELLVRERLKMLKDSFGRTIDYMRISVTDRCNLRCGYCMPHGIKQKPMAEILRYEEIAFICAQAAGLGIDRFRITGGEPLVRKNCETLVSMLKRIPGVRQVALTTNGVLLAEQLDALLEAGIDAVNISLDTTDREQYKAITGMDELDRVLASIRLAAGKLPVKINCVVQRGVNEDAPVHLATLARDLPADVRFIELMPIGMAKNLQTVPNAETLAGRIGFISAVHGKFCATCNRLRLTSTGELKPCLCYGDVIPLREILRDGEGRKEERIREKIMEAVQSKPMAHCFEHRENITENREMVRIGG